MDRVDSDKKKNLDVAVWKDYNRILDAIQDQKTEITYLERYQFYERAKKAYGTKIIFSVTKILIFVSVIYSGTIRGCLSDVRLGSVELKV
jgi:L-fucose mutarotase/ribose pyranase (RbsD/FucU family)